MAALSGDSNDPNVPGVEGTGIVGVAGIGAQTGVIGTALPQQPGSVGVRGDAPGLPVPEGFPTVGVMGTAGFFRGIGVQGINQSGGFAGDFQGSVNVNGGIIAIGGLSNIAIHGAAKSAD